MTGSPWCYDMEKVVSPKQQFGALIQSMRRVIMMTYLTSHFWIWLVTIAPGWLTWPAVVCRRSAVAAVASGPRAVGACAPPEFSAAAAWPATRNICKNSLPDIYNLCQKKLDSLSGLPAWWPAHQWTAGGRGWPSLSSPELSQFMKTRCRISIGKCHDNCKCYFPVQWLEKSHWVGQMITLCFMRAHCGLKCQFIIVWTSLDGYHFQRLVYLGASSKWLFTIISLCYTQWCWC